MEKRSELNVDSIETALRYLRFGYRPIPIVAGGKRPASNWKRFQAEVPTERKIVEWFSGVERNIALVTGRGVVVVDVDDRDFVDAAVDRFGATPMRCKTAGGGVHLYYATAPGDSFANAVRINGDPVDLRGDGGYAVCPWSRDGHGGGYEWIEGPIHANELPPIKAFALAVPAPRRVVMPADVGSDCDGMIRRARGYLANIEGAIAGYHGHDRTFRVACVLTVKFGLTLEQAWPLFQEWNGQCEPRWSDKELLHKLQDAIKMRFVSRKEGV